MCNEYNHVGIRCPGKRSHTVKGKEYDICGSMLFGMNPDVTGDDIVQCRVCKRWYRIICDGNGSIEVEELLDGKNIKFSSRG